MRVLVVTTWFPSTDRPGVAPFNVAHAKAIARSHDVEVVHVRLAGSGPVVEDKCAGLPVVRIPFGPRQPLTVANGLALLRRLARDADVVHSMAFSALGVLAPLTPLIGRRWVHTEHWSGVAYPHRISRTWERLAGARRLLRLPRAVSAVTSALAREIERYARASTVDVIPCVVDESFGVSEQPAWEPLKLVSVGGLVPGKRPTLAVDTVRVLVDHGVDAQLTWVGGGPLADEVRQRAAAIGVADRVCLVGQIPSDQVARHVRAANLFFLPTAFENFLTSAAESLACGRPVVLPRTGGFTDYVSDANGVLAESDDPGGLADAVLKARDVFAGTPADAFRATVIPRFSEQTVAQRFDQLYGRLEG